MSLYTQLATVPLDHAPPQGLKAPKYPDFTKYPAGILHIITEIGYCGVGGLFDTQTRSGRQNDTKPKHVAVPSFLSDSDPYVYAISDLKATDTILYGTKRIHRLHLREKEEKVRNKKDAS